MFITNYTLGFISGNVESLFDLIFKNLASFLCNISRFKFSFKIVNQYNNFCQKFDPMLKIFTQKKLKFYSRNF